MTFSASLIVAALFGLIFALALWGVRRRIQAPEEVRTVLERAGFEVLQIQHRFIRLGPFFPTTTRSQLVFRILVREPSGRRRTGWARWGRKWLPEPDTLELKWD